MQISRDSQKQQTKLYHALGSWTTCRIINRRPPTERREPAQNLHEFFAAIGKIERPHAENPVNPHQYPRENTPAPAPTNRKSSTCVSISSQISVSTRPTSTNLAQNRLPGVVLTTPGRGERPGPIVVIFTSSSNSNHSWIILDLPIDLFTLSLYSPPPFNPFLHIWYIYFTLNSSPSFLTYPQIYPQPSSPP